jgi:hypothetical protein
MGKVFDSEDPKFCWDGKFRGNELNSGVFVYYINATVKDVGEIVRKGNKVSYDALYVR